MKDVIKKFQVQKSKLKKMSPMFDLLENIFGDTFHVTISKGHHKRSVGITSSSLNDEPRPGMLLHYRMRPCNAVVGWGELPWPAGGS